jgi:hypothetical protein
MPMRATSGSGEPPIGKDYSGEKALPRSGLLEHRVESDSLRRRFAPPPLAAHAQR